ncbi:hypothetical protein LPW36_00835 [Jinshanibacter sp. LJY008]|uniref:Lipoprotein n=1 Tax=Limnobaculum eriocheiris TaxID=2897391 RepID=A0A9X1SIM0_9GAMM|nr:hypothetical protein [Limnobaculum eriocheiris]MCD1124593.1 hypothetical protein [Limnobaculum eriocheiris]
MKRTLMLAAVGLVLISINGCAKFEKKNTPQANSNEQSYNQRFQGCLVRLETLKKLDFNSYNQSKMMMDSNMETATKYLAMRSTLGPDTVNVMDSVYQAKLARTCQHIDGQIYSLLLEQADRK